MEQRSRVLHYYSTATAIAAYLLLIAGSLVTSNDAGLAVPDWPLSYGTWFPPMVGGIFYEHGHRMIAGIVGIMILILSIGLARSESRIWVRRLGFTALAAVFVQALLGGLTVLLLLPPQISIAHACLGQAVFCVVVFLGLATSPRWREKPLVWHEAPRGLRILGLLIGAFAALQLVLGAIIRHTGTTAAWHMIGAGMLAITALAYFRSVRNDKTAPAILKKNLSRLLLLIAVQISSGVFVFASRAYVPLRTMHLGVGALLLAQAAVLAWQTTRHILSNR